MRCYRNEFRRWIRDFRGQSCGAGWQILRFDSLAQLIEILVGVGHVLNHILWTSEVRGTKPTCERRRLRLGRALLQVLFSVHLECVHVERLPPTESARTMRTHVDRRVSAAVNYDGGDTWSVFEVFSEGER